MTKETEAVLFYTAAIKDGTASVSKEYVERIDEVFRKNKDMCLKKRFDKKRNCYCLAIIPAKLPDEVYKNIIDYLNQRLKKSFKYDTKETQQLINQRFAEGYGIEDFKKVIDNMINEWYDDKEMSRYLRPITLFGNKFESYLNIVKAVSKNHIAGKPSFNIDVIQNDAMNNTEIRYS